MRVGHLPIQPITLFVTIFTACLKTCNDEQSKWQNSHAVDCISHHVSMLRRYLTRIVNEQEQPPSPKHVGKIQRCAMQNVKALLAACLASTRG